MKSKLLTALGWFFVALGMVGVVLPLVPTTPFLLLALLCFSRSSPNFYHWLYRHRVFGESLRAWQEERRIPKSAWVMIGVMLSISATVSLYWVYTRT